MDFKEESSKLNRKKLQGPGNGLWNTLARQTNTHISSCEDREKCLNACF